MLFSGIQPCLFVHVLSVADSGRVVWLHRNWPTRPKIFTVLLFTEKICQALDRYMFMLIRNCQNVFLKWLYHFSLLPAINGNSSSALGIANLFKFSHLEDVEWYLIVVLICSVLTGLGKWEAMLLSPYRASVSVTMPTPFMPIVQILVWSMPQAS